MSALSRSFIKPATLTLLTLASPFAANAAETPSRSDAMGLKIMKGHDQNSLTTLFKNRSAASITAIETLSSLIVSTFEEGYSESNVRKIQYIVNDIICPLGYECGDEGKKKIKVDGKFGPQTAHATLTVLLDTFKTGFFVIKPEQLDFLLSHLTDHPDKERIDKSLATFYTGALKTETSAFLKQIDPFGENDKGQITYTQFGNRFHILYVRAKENFDNLPKREKTPADKEENAIVSLLEKSSNEAFKSPQAEINEKALMMVIEKTFPHFEHLNSFDDYKSDPENTALVEGFIRKVGASILKFNAAVQHNREIKKNADNCNMSCRKASLEGPESKRRFG